LAVHIDDNSNSTGYRDSTDSSNKSVLVSLIADANPTRFARATAITDVNVILSGCEIYSG
jgi:hypothetical protein